MISLLGTDPDSYERFLTWRGMFHKSIKFIPRVEEQFLIKLITLQHTRCALVKFVCLFVLTFSRFCPPSVCIDFLTAFESLLVSVLTLINVNNKPVRLLLWLTS